MKNYVLTLIFIYFFLCAYENYAMQPGLKAISSTISKEIDLPKSSHAIACNDQGDIFFTDNSSCGILNYKTALPTILRRLNSGERILKGKIYDFKNNTELLELFYVIENDNKLYYIHNNALKSDISHIKDPTSNILFDSLGISFFTIKNKQLQRYNLICDCMASYYSTTDFKVIISDKISKQSYFLCSDYTALYKFQCNQSECTTEKLCNFFCKLNWDHWIYNPRFDLFCALTEDNQHLYIADVLKQKQMTFPLFNFKTAALLLHPNKRILTLLSAERDKICYLDSQKLQSLLITEHVVTEDDLKNINNGQIMGCSSDGKDIIVLLSGKYLVIKVPAWIREIDTYEKYSFLRKFTILSQDLQQLIGKVLLNMYHKSK